MRKVAIFFDAENVSAKTVPQIFSFLSTKGEILIQRAYADWSIKNTDHWKEQLTKTPIIAIQQFHHNQEQAVDKVIMMDAIELAIKHEEIDIFALVSSDNGFYSLALRLRELGKRVIGIGEKKKCGFIWINSCNEFAYFEDLEENDDNILLEKDKKEEESPNELKGYALEMFFEKAFDSTPQYKETNTVLLSQMWESVLRMKSDFNVKDYGYKTPLELLRTFEEKFKISDDGKTQRTFFVEKIENFNTQRKQGIIKRRIKSYGIIQAEDKSGEYFFYIKEVNPEFKNDLAQFEKNTKVDFLVEKNPNPNATDSRDKNGRAKDLRIIS